MLRQRILIAFLSGQLILRVSHLEENAARMWMTLQRFREQLFCRHNLFPRVPFES